MIKLTDEYFIKYTESTGGYALHYVSKEKYETVNQKTKEVSLKSKTDAWFYGTLYQALQGFLRRYVVHADSLDGVISKTQEAMQIIDEKVKNIETSYKIVKYWR